MRWNRSCLVIVAIMLAACGASKTTNNPINPPGPNPTQCPVQASPQVINFDPNINGDDFAYVVSVKLLKSDVKDQMEQQLGGKVLVWRPEQSFGLMGLSEESARYLSISAGNMMDRLQLEENKKSFLAGGVMSAWSEGVMSAWSEGVQFAWSEGVQFAWSEGKYKPMPQNTGSFKSIGLEEAQKIASKLGKGVKVAVIDSGIDLEHPAFACVLAPAAEMRDYVEGDSDPQEVGELGKGGFGHGTNVAGIVRQIAPLATLLPIRVLGSDGSGYISDVAAAIDWAVEKGANIINLSLGSDESSGVIEQAIVAALARGVVVVSSSGNSGNTSVSYPAAVSGQNPSWLGVGSVGANLVKSTFSTYGLGVEVLAPGELVFGPAPGKRLGAWSGTSQAAPMASGAVALALAEGFDAPVNLVEHLEHTAINLDHIPANAQYAKVNGLGHGAINVGAYIRSLAQLKK